MDKRICRQSGVALISVLLVFAIATVIAGDVMTRNYRDLRKTANFINGKQAYHFALSGEQFARQILYRDYREQKDIGVEADTLTDLWAENLPTFNIEGGEMTIEIHDLQGRLNLNNFTLGAATLQDFKDLQTTLALSGDYAGLIRDWQDSDTSPSPKGAEDADYTGSYLPANRPFADITELHLLPGMDTQDYLKLTPYVTALPLEVDGTAMAPTKYNINTLDAKLLEAISTLTAAEAQQVARQQQQGGYLRLDDWYTGAVGAKLKAIAGKLDNKSAFFEVVVTANYQQRIAVLTTYLHRNPKDGSITIIKRQLGGAASVSPGNEKT